MQALPVGLKEILGETRPKADEDQKLRKACREFESVFTYELLKGMRRTVEKCDLFHGGQGEEMYESLLDQELSKTMAGIGPRSLASILYLQLKKEGRAEIMEGSDPMAWKELERPAAPINAMQGGAVSSTFGWRKDPFSGEDRFHYGVDFAASEGTPVRAPMPGKVLLAGYRAGYGNLVVLDHGHGLTTLYAHNRENTVSEGDWVRQGTPLAKVGSTGRSTGPHLHFEVRKDGRQLDPLAFLREGREG
ncbi:MAG: peptidoglycan DD-metalloendopeptidase family protein [Thermodesulfobacteriota bacterium]